VAVSTKDVILESLQQLPANATLEDAMEQLYFLGKVERGLEQSEAGLLIPHDEVKKRFSSHV
jgi:predicted transcriptional regulator